VSVEKWIYGGDGLARIDGRVVLVPYVLPGEVARVAVDGRDSDLWRGTLESVIVPSTERVEPPCPYFGRCGGCQYQHAPYPFQVEQKRAIVREVMRRVGKFDAPEVIDAVTGPEWEYRNRVQFHVVNGEIGYLEAGSHRLCPVDRCPVASPRVNEALIVLREMIRDRRWPRFARAVEVFTNETEIQINVLETEQPVARSFFEWCAERLPGARARVLEYPVAGDTFRVGYRSFFQVNRFLVERLVDLALQGAEGSAALDLYAGVGLFSLPLARRFSKVTAIEASASAVADLEFNAARAGVTAALTAVRGPVETVLPRATETSDFVLADPPRAGLGKTVVRELLRLAPARLTIVACDAATLARDLAQLRAGGYAVDSLTVVDLFPQTAHIETVARLRKI
jgi:23S rRNA (uracil1939-C5)-methyltransferase